MTTGDRGTPAEPSSGQQKHLASHCCLDKDYVCAEVWGVLCSSFVAVDTDPPPLSPASLQPTSLLRSRERGGSRSRSRNAIQNAETFRSQERRSRPTAQVPALQPGTTSPAPESPFASPAAFPGDGEVLPSLGTAQGRAPGPQVQSWHCTGGSRSPPGTTCEGKPQTGDPGAGQGPSQPPVLTLSRESLPLASPRVSMVAHALGDSSSRGPAGPFLTRQSPP